MFESKAFLASLVFFLDFDLFDFDNKGVTETEIFADEVEPDVAVSVTISCIFIKIFNLLMIW